MKSNAGNAIDTKIIAIAGGSGSGKTTFARRLCESLGASECVIIPQDNYYLDQTGNFDFDGGKVNFDHPESIDFALMAKHLKCLKLKQSINIPLYDFKTHARLKATKEVMAKRLILVDGILILSRPELREIFDLAFFIDCPEAIRFERRLRRDVEERGRTPYGVSTQFFRQVAPMHDKFVDPSRVFASEVVTIDTFDEKLNEAKSKLLH